MYILEEGHFCISSLVFLEFFSQGLVENGGGVFEPLGQVSPGQLLWHPLFIISPFKCKEVLAPGAQGEAEKKHLLSLGWCTTPVRALGC